MRFNYALVERRFGKTSLNIARRQLITKDRYNRMVNNFFSPEEALRSIITYIFFLLFPLNDIVYVSGAHDMHMLHVLFTCLVQSESL